jgi:hypothetical protein
MKNKHVVYLVLALLALSAILACSFFSQLVTEDDSVATEERTSSEEQGEEAVQENSGDQENQDTQQNLEPIVGTWKQIEFQGIGDGNNISIGGAGVWFGDYYYVGTRNAGFSYEGACGGQVAVGPAVQVPQPQSTQEMASASAELWRTRDGVQWEVVGEPGLGNPDYTTLQTVLFQDRLFIFTYPMSLLVSNDGQNFDLVKGGWENTGIQNMLVNRFINDLLFVNGHEKQSGIEAWTSSDGERFTPVEDYFGDPDKISLCGNTSTAFNEWYYLGVANFTSGGELWRSRDGRTWEQSLAGGYDDSLNGTLCSSLIYKDFLYATLISNPTSASRHGVEAIRTADGENWEKVIEDGFGLGEWQGYSGTFKVYKEALYFVLWNFPPASGGPASTGFRLWRSLDGKTWEQIGEPGFGYSEKYTAIPYVIRDVFYLIAYNQCDGNQIWSSTDGTNWELFYTFPARGEQFGPYLVEIADSLEYFEGNSMGLHIWRYGP